MKMKILLPITLVVLSVSGCGVNHVDVSHQKDYGIVISEFKYFELDGSSFIANVSWVNGKTLFPATPSVDLAPGHYIIQLGLNCGSTKTCHPGIQYGIDVKAGERYEIRSNGIFVGDRFAPHNKDTEARYKE